MNLQEVIDHGLTYDVIPLPLGEYEGPFYVRKPCTLVGNVTTLYSKQGPALVVESNGVTLANLRVENIQGTENAGNDLALLSRERDTVCQNVEIIGSAQGLVGEEGRWQYPRVLSLGHFPAGQQTVFKMDIVVPTAVDVLTNITGLHLSPEHLEAGRQTLTLTFDPCRHGTFFYGEIRLYSQLVHMIYLSALADEAVTLAPVDKIYTPEKQNVKPVLEESLVISSILDTPDRGCVSPNHPVLNEQKQAENLKQVEPLGTDVIVLQRGERRNLSPEMIQNLQVSLTYTERNDHLDIDPYVVLLNAQGRAQRDEDLIFFGNVRSQCGSVVYQEAEKMMSLSLTTLPIEVEKVSVVFAIYGDDTGNNFSKLKDPALQVKQNGREIWRFPIIDLTAERTIVAAEFYRYKGQWKMNAVGAGYKQGLERLLADYGLEVL